MYAGTIAHAPETLRAVKMQRADLAERVREFATEKLDDDVVTSALRIVHDTPEGIRPPIELVRFGKWSAGREEYGDGVWNTAGHSCISAFVAVDVDDVFAAYDTWTVWELSARVTRHSVTWEHHGSGAVRTVDRTGLFKKELMEHTWHPSRLRWCLDTEEAADLL